jgi:hypothetical protein
MTALKHNTATLVSTAHEQRLAPPAVNSITVPTTYSLLNISAEYVPEFRPKH